MKNAVFWDVAAANAGYSHADFSILKMEAIRSSETSVHTRSRRHHIPEDGILQQSTRSPSLEARTSEYDLEGPLQQRSIIRVSIIIKRRPDETEFAEYTRPWLCLFAVQPLCLSLLLILLGRRQFRIYSKLPNRLIDAK
jgi:hypothetical protein